MSGLGSARSCVITGGSRGIGLATALRFARGGGRVVVAARGTADLQGALDALRAAGAECEAVPADVGTPQGARDLIDVARARFGRVDVLVNNAGVAPLGTIEAMREADFHSALTVNVAAVFYLTQAVWPLMRVQGGGTIVNVSSVASVDPFAGFSVYGACKAWVNLFTRAAADEGKPHRIRVFCVAPGAVETRMLRAHFREYPADQTLDPDDVAGVIEALCDARFDPCVGQTIFVRR